MAQADIWASLLLAYSAPPQHMLSTVGLVPRAPFAGGRGLWLLLSVPLFLQTGLILKPARAAERGCVIQRA